MRPLALAAAILLAGCHADRLRPAGDGAYEVRSRAAVEQAQEAALAVAAELGHPARVRDGAVEVELAVAPPMSERPSPWLRVTVAARGRGTVTVIQSLPRVAVPPHPAPPASPEAYAYADLLADRLAEAGRAEAR